MFQIAIRCGLCILLALLYSDNAHQLCTDWSLHDLIRLVKENFPDFPLKAKLLSLIASVIPDDPENDWDNDISVDKEICNLVKVLSAYTGPTSKNPIPRLLQLLEGGERSSTDNTSCSAVDTFLQHNGVIHLSVAVETNNSAIFKENALK